MANTLEKRIATRIARRKSAIFIREDFSDLAGYDQVGRALRSLALQGKLIKIAYGIYAKTRRSLITGEVIPEKSLPSLAKEALQRLGVETAPSTMEKDYNAGRTTQVPTGRMIAVKGRIQRKIGYNGAYVSFERITK
ncbi:MAG: DUF6088 family protein [Bacteroidetes bacterium]|nr:DUF6088 family protein [Bacteroidota bacterium]